jgi:Na+/melibiose symporter-like transporter
MVKFLDDRQKRTGWLLVVVSGAYLLYFLKVRLLTAGLPIEKKEWIYFAAMIVCLMLGTANLRLAAARERRKQSGPTR